MRTEIIVSTYNSPRALRLTLVTLLAQNRLPDSVCIADDGSKSDTANMLSAFAAKHSRFPLRHVWQEDGGFRKASILNRAANTSDADYLLFTDGDCLLPPGFVARHLERSGRWNFCSGSLIRLTRAATEEVNEETIVSGKVWDRGWLRERQIFERATTWLKTMPFPKKIQSALEKAYPIRTTFMGSNASVFREAMLAVNGFNESMAYGGEDKEFGVRLANSGIRGRSLRFTTPVVHLEHTRFYKDALAAKRHRELINSARRMGKTFSDHGIYPLQEENGNGGVK